MNYIKKSLIYLIALVLVGCFSTSNDLGYYLDNRYSGEPVELLKKGDLKYDSLEGVQIYFRHELWNYSVISNANRIRTRCGGFRSVGLTDFDKIIVRFKMRRTWGRDGEVGWGGLSDEYYLDGQDDFISYNHSIENTITNLCAEGEISGIYSITKLGCSHLSDDTWHGEVVSAKDRTFRFYKGEICGEFPGQGTMIDVNGVTAVCKRTMKSSEAIITECTEIGPDGNLSEVYVREINPSDTSENYKTGPRFLYSNQDGNKSEFGDFEVSWFIEGKEKDAEVIIYSNKKNEIYEQEFADREYELKRKLKKEQNALERTYRLAPEKTPPSYEALELLLARDPNDECYCAFNICLESWSVDTSYEEQKRIKEKRKAKYKLCRVLAKAGILKDESLRRELYNNLDTITRGNIPNNLSGDVRGVIDEAVSDYRTANSSLIHYKESVKQAAAELKEFRAKAKRDTEAKAAQAARDEMVRLQKIAARKQEAFEKYKACVIALGFDWSKRTDWPVEPDQCS